MQIAEWAMASDEPFVLAPIGDIQYGSAGCDVEKLSEHIKCGTERGWFFLGMGDYLDVASPSNRRALKVANLYESTKDLIDQGITKQVEDLVDAIKSEGRWIAAVHGDHGGEFGDGQPYDALIARKLRAEYLGTSGFVLIRVPGYKTPLKIWMTHGKRASATNPTGLSLEFQRHMSRFDADIFLLGHAHQNFSVRIETLVPWKTKGKLGIVSREKMGVATGSWMNGWVYGSKNAHGWPEGGYVEKGVLSPLPTGAPIISVYPTRKHGVEVFELRGSA
jgi:hypothetical protein